MKITAVIMAGGRGERFWPRSRTNCPKQFLSLTADGETMIQKTVNRLKPLVAPEDVFIVTNVHYAELVQQQLGKRTVTRYRRRKYFAGTVRQKYSAVYRTGCRCDSEKVPGSHDAGAAIGSSDSIR